MFPFDMKRTLNTYVTQFSQSDPQLIFQKLTAAGSVTLNTTAELLQYEHSIVSSSIFESFGLLEQAAKATLGETILIIGDCHSHELPRTNLLNGFDGGSLLHRILGPKAGRFPRFAQNMYITSKGAFKIPSLSCVGTLIRQLMI